MDQPLAAAGPPQLAPPENGWRVVYFDAPNRGECIRLILTVAEQPFEDVRLVFPSGLAPYKSATAGDASPLPFGQAPVVQHGDAARGVAVSIGQTAAAAQYAGAATGLAPTDPPELARATSACIGVQEMYNALFYTAFIPRIICKVACGSWCARCCASRIGCCRCWHRWGKARDYAKWMGTYERWLRVKASGAAPSAAAPTFLAGDALSFADVCLFDCLEAVEGVGFFSRDDRLLYPYVCALVDHVGDIPTVAAYLAERAPRF